MAQTQTQIAQDLITAITTSTSDATNFNVGSLIRGLIDGFSAESAQIEAQILSQVATAIVNVIYQVLPVKPITAAGSTYLLTLSNASVAAITVAEGTTVTIPNSSLQWEIGQAVTLSPNSSVSVTATCTTVGTITNVPANVITQFVVPVANVTVTNPSAQPVVQGRDAPTQTLLQAQVANAVNSLHKGDTGAIEEAALTSELVDAAGNPTEQVVKAVCIDSQTAGESYCIVYNGVGPMSTALLAQTQDIVDGYTDTDGTVHIGAKAAGVICTVQDAPETVVNVAVSVLPKYGYSLAMVTPNVQNAVENYFAQLNLGQQSGTGLSVPQLYQAILSAQGVGDALITSPSGSLPAVPLVDTPSSAPTLAAVTGTTALAAGVYTAGYSFANEWGQTQLSPTATVTLGTAGEQIQVAAITLATGSTSVNYYLSTEVGGTTLAYAASGTGAQINLTALPAATAASIPTDNTALIQGNAYVLGALNISQLSEA